jgi:hypothetical protein
MKSTMPEIRQIYHNLHHTLMETHRCERPYTFGRLNNSNNSGSLFRFPAKLIMVTVANLQVHLLKLLLLLHLLQYIN